MPDSVLHPQPAFSADQPVRVRFASEDDLISFSLQAVERRDFPFTIGPGSVISMTYGDFEYLKGVLSGFNAQVENARAADRPSAQEVAAIKRFSMSHEHHVAAWRKLSKALTRETRHHLDALRRGL